MTTSAAYWYRGTRINLGRADDMAVISLTRADRRNAIDLECAGELLRVVSLCAADQTTKFIVLRAPGGYFCVGGDIGEFSAQQHRIEDHFLDITGIFHRAILILAEAPAVSIAVVEGAAAGAGFALALSCDLLVASTQARFIPAYSRLGLSPDGGASYFLTRQLGKRQAFEILALGREFSADEALDLGFATHIAAPETVEEVLATLLATLRLATPESLATCKMLVGSAVSSDLARQLDAERIAIARLAIGEEPQRRIQRFLGPRPQRPKA